MNWTEWLLQYSDPTIDWNYAVVTLVVRFIGVFIVMAMVQLALQAAGLVVHRVDARNARVARKPEPPVRSLDISAMADHQAEVDGAVVAAIALALAVESRPPSAGQGTDGASPGRSSAWAMAGRLRNMR